MLFHHHRSVGREIVPPSLLQPFFCGKKFIEEKKAQITKFLYTQFSCSNPLLIWVIGNDCAQQMVVIYSIFHIPKHLITPNQSYSLKSVIDFLTHNRLQFTLPAIFWGEPWGYVKICGFLITLISCGTPGSEIGNKRGKLMRIYRSIEYYFTEYRIEPHRWMDSGKTHKYHSGEIDIFSM